MGGGRYSSGMPRPASPLRMRAEAEWPAARALLQSSNVLLFEPNRRRNQTRHTHTIHVATTQTHPDPDRNHRDSPPRAIPTAPRAVSETAGAQATDKYLGKFADRAEVLFKSRHMRTKGLGHLARSYVAYHDVLPLPGSNVPKPSRSLVSCGNRMPELVGQGSVSMPFLVA